jgi:type IV pilus assembly protein PilX
MMKIPPSRSPQRRLSAQHGQQGVVLVVSLILLVVMTFLGLTSVKLASSEERMAAQSYDRNLTFQAAEAQLRQAEISIEAAAIPTPAPLATCSEVSAGDKNLNVCGVLAPESTPRWISTSFASWATGTPVGSGKLAITPTYFVEYLGNTFPCGFDPSTSAANCKRYRVTSRAKAADGRAAVTLQSIYATP